MATTNTRAGSSRRLRRTATAGLLGLGVLVLSSSPASAEPTTTTTSSPGLPCGMESPCVVTIDGAAARAGAAFAGCSLGVLAGALLLRGRS